MLFSVTDWTCALERYSNEEQMVNQGDIAGDKSSPILGKKQRKCGYEMLLSMSAAHGVYPFRNGIQNDL